MKLSELTTGQEAYITRVNGSGAIKKRINEMGFIAGQKVKAVKSAPLKDPVEYDIMGYLLTIRKKDADMILIEQSPSRLNKELLKVTENMESDEIPYLIDHTNRIPKDQKTINVALVGNPNCGKTTIFNFATNSREKVANYSGVTVAAKEAKFEINGYTLNVIDLPGTYSLSSYSPEEMFVTDYLLFHTPDIIINVLDSGNLERNLFLTTQLIDSGIKTVVALNMFDEFESNEGTLDHNKLGELLGIPFIPTVGKRGKGLNSLFEKVIQVFNRQEKISRSIRIPYGKDIEDAIIKIQRESNFHNTVFHENSRLISLQMLEEERNIFSVIPDTQRNRLKEMCKNQRDTIETLLNQDINTEIINRRYGFIEGALSETFKKAQSEKTNISQKIDSVLTHKILGLPVFFAIIWFIFFSTFKLGEFPMKWIDNTISWISVNLSDLLPEGILNNLIVDGIIGGVGGVLVFLPNIMILFFLISLMEDSGYMARTAFLMDKVMHKAGLHGKSFIPLLIGFGCNVPAIMATRTIESKRDRLVTMFITPFMSCSARLPVYVLFISAFFPRFESLVLFLMYAIGIIAALLTAIILNKTVFKKSESPFVMELPPYRIPTLKSVGKHTWFKTSHFLKKMGTIILIASVVVWALGYFPRNEEIINRYDTEIAQQKKTLDQNNESQLMNLENEIIRLENLKQSELLEQSFISRIGKAIQPVFEPLGFDWKMSVSILTGIVAKEVVVSSMGLLFQAGSDPDESNAGLVNKLQTSKEATDTPLVTYFGFLVFTLLYFPCMGTLVAIKKETAKYRWMLFSAIYPFIFAWITTFLIYQVGNLF